MASPVGSSAPRVRASTDRRALWVTIVLAFGQDAVYALIYLSYMNHYLLDELHASGGLPGYTLALYGATKLVVHPVAGRLLDRTNPRLVFRGAVAMQCSALALVLVLHSLWAFLLAAPMLAAGSAAMWPLIYDIVARTQPGEARAGVTGTLSLSGYLATGAGFALGVAVSDLAPWPVAFLAGLALIAGPLAFHGAHALDPGERTWNALPDEARLGALSKVASVALFGLVVLIDYAAITSLAGVYGPYTHLTLGLSLVRTTFLLAPAGVTALVALFLSARFSRPHRRYVEMAGLYLLAGLGALGLAIAPNQWAAMALAPLVAAGAGGIGPIIAATMIEQGAEGDRGVVIGALMSIEGIGSVVGPAATALIVDLASPRAALAFVGLLFAGLIPLAFVANARARNHHPERVPIASRR